MLLVWLSGKSVPMFNSGIVKGFSGIQFPVSCTEFKIPKFSDFNLSISVAVGPNIKILVVVNVDRECRLV